MLQDPSFDAKTGRRREFHLWKGLCIPMTFGCVRRGGRHKSVIILNCSQQFTYLSKRKGL